MTIEQEMMKLEYERMKSASTSFRAGRQKYFDALVTTYKEVTGDLEADRPHIPRILQGINDLKAENEELKAQNTDLQQQFETLGTVTEIVQERADRVTESNIELTEKLAERDKALAGVREALTLIVEFAGSRVFDIGKCATDALGGIPAPPPITPEVFVDPRWG